MGSGLPWNSQVAIGFLRNASTNPPCKEGPIACTCTALSDSVKSVHDTKRRKTCKDPTDGILWIRACLYLSQIRAAKAKTSLRTCTVSPECSRTFVHKNAKNGTYSTDE